MNGRPCVSVSNSPRKWHAATPCSLAALAPPRLSSTPLALGRLSNCPPRALCMLTPIGHGPRYLYVRPMILRPLPLVLTDEASNYIRRAMFNLKRSTSGNSPKIPGSVAVFAISPMCMVGNKIPPDGVYTICMSNKMEYELNTFDYYRYDDEIIEAHPSFIQENKSRLLSVWSKVSNSIESSSGLYFL